MPTVHVILHQFLKLLEKVWSPGETTSTTLGSGEYETGGTTN